MFAGKGRLRLAARQERLAGTNSSAYLATFVSAEEEETSFDNITLGNDR